MSSTRPRTVPLASALALATIGALVVDLVVSVALKSDPLWFDWALLAIVPIFAIWILPPAKRLLTGVAKARESLMGSLPTLGFAEIARSAATIHEADDSTSFRRLPIDSVEQLIPLIPLMCAVVLSGLAWSMLFSKPAQAWLADRSEEAQRS